MFDCPICCEDTTCGVVKSGCCGTEICLQCFTDIGSRVPSYAAGPQCPFCRGAYALWNPERLAVRQADIMMRAGAVAKTINTRASAIAHMQGRLKHYQTELDSAQRSQAAEMQMFQVHVREAVKANCVDSVQALIRPAGAGAGAAAPVAANPYIQISREARAELVRQARLAHALAEQEAQAAEAEAARLTELETTTRCAGCQTRVPNGEIRSRLGSWPRGADGAAGDRRRLVRCDGCAAHYP
jgi:hypothetical protein